MSTIEVAEQLDIDHWQRLLDKVTPSLAFCNHHWFESWANSMLPYRSWKEPLKYYLVRNNDNNIIGIFPLAMQLVGPLTVTSLGGYCHPFRTGLIADGSEEEACTTLIDHFGHSPSSTILRFGPTAAGAKWSDRLFKQFYQRGWHLHSLPSSAHFLLHLPDSTDALLQQLGKSKLKKINRYHNRMKKAGDVRIVKYNSLTAQEWQRVIQDLVHIESHSWLATKGGDFKFADTHNSNFWRHYLSTETGSKAATAWVLYFNNEPVCFNFSLDSGDCRYLIATSYISSVRDYRAGSILYKQRLVDSVEQGIKVVDAGQGDGGYKRQWGFTPFSKPLDWIAIKPTMKGTLLNMALHTKNVFDQYLLKR